MGAFDDLIPANQASGSASTDPFADLIPNNRSTPNQPAVTALPQEEASPAFGVDQLPFMDPTVPAEPVSRGLGATAMPTPPADAGMRPVIPFDPAAPGGILSTPIPGPGPMTPQDQWAQRIGAIQQTLREPGLDADTKAQLEQTLADLMEGQIAMQGEPAAPDATPAPAGAGDDMMTRARTMRDEALAEAGGALSPGFDLDAFAANLEPNPVRGPAGSNADPFASEGLGALVERRGQQFAAGATDVFAGLPESAAIAAARLDQGIENTGNAMVDRQRTLIAEAEAMLADPAINPSLRPGLEQKLADLQSGLADLQPAVEGRRDPIPANERQIFAEGQRLRDASGEYFGTPDPRDTSFWAQVAQGGGNMSAMAVSSVAATLVGGPIAGLGAGATLGAGMTAPQLYNEAIAAGADEETAQRAAQWGIAIGASEIVPIQRALQLLPPRLRGEITNRVLRQFTDIAQGSGEEAAQEYLSQVAQNITAQQLYDADRGWTENATQGALVGAVLGGGLGAVGVAMTPAERERDRPMSPRLTADDRASPIPNNVIDDGKAMIEQILSGEPLPQIPSTDAAPNQTAPTQPAAPAFVPAGAVPLDTLYADDATGTESAAAQDPISGPVSGSEQQTMPAAPQAPALTGAAGGPIPTPDAIVAPAAPALATSQPGEAPASSAPVPITPEMARINGVEAFGAGQPRVPPRSLWSGRPVKEGNRLAEEWTRGWDRANIAAPIPETAPDGQPAAQTTAPAVSGPETGQAAPAPNLEVLTNAEIANVGTNPEVFQYKAGADSSGVTDRLRGVKKWDSNRTGVALVYEYADGRREIADGHQRLDLAKRLAAEGQQVDLPVRVLRETDGFTPADARRIAAEKNIAEGSGTALDAAKIFRDTRMTASDLNLPRNSAIVRDGDALAKLSPQAFGMVVNEVASQKYGAVVGQIVPEQDKHANILGLLARLKPSNQTEAESIVRQAMSADVVETQTDMFGSMEVSENLYMERARIMDEALRSLGRKISTFKTLKEQGDIIEKAGNVLAPDANEAQLQGDAVLRSALMQQANTKGPISDALTQAARTVKAGGKVADAARQFVATVQAIDSGSPQDGAGTGDTGPRDQSAQETGPSDPLDEPNLFDSPPAKADAAPVPDLEAPAGNVTEVSGSVFGDLVPTGKGSTGAAPTKTTQSSPKRPENEQQKPAAPSAPAVKQPLLNAAEQAEADALLAEIDALMRGQLNAGLDPKMFMLAARLGELYVKGGLRRFRAYARAIADKLKRPMAELSRMLRDSYNSVRDEMEAQGESVVDMDDGRAVMQEMARLIQEEKAAPVSMVMPTYISRPVVNAEDIRAWAAEYGFKTTVPADEMHVTLIYSKTPVDQASEAFRPQADTIIVEGGPRKLRSFGDAVVLTFDDFSITERNRGLMEAGASSDFPVYHPHITITYDAGNVNLAAVAPYRGLIELGPETVEPIKEDATADLQETKPKAGEDAPALNLSQMRDRITNGFLTAFRDGKKFATIIEARKAVKDFTGTDYTSDMAKTLEEAIEVAVVHRAREIVAKGKAPDATFEAMVALYAAQPKLAERTSTSIEMQAYSTPAPLGYLASRLARVETGAVVYEPTAGNGMLLMEADPAKVKANEMQPSRVDGLRRVLGPEAKITTGDAMANEPGSYGIFLANPPFGKVRDETGKTKVWTMQQVGGETSQIDHAIVMKGLDEMPADGQAVLIIGGQKYDDQEKRREAYTTDQNRRFFKRLYDNYNVVEHFTVDGRLYERQGAGWPVDVIVVHGKGQSKKPYPMREAPVVYGTWQEIGERLDGKDSLDPRQLGLGTRDGGNGTTDKPDDDGSVSRPSGRTDSGDGGRNPAGGTGTTDRPGSKSGQPDNLADPDRGGAGLGQRDPVLPERDGNLSLADQSRPDQTVTDGDGGGGILSGLSRTPVSRNAVKRENAEVETSFQTQYEPRSQSTFAVGTLVPKNMQQAMTRALDALEQRVGNIDTFVAKELGYTPDQLLGTKDEPGYFSAEQVDALALAIDNVSQGKGFIIGDQCVAGETRIFNPESGQHVRIDALAEGGFPHSVLALTGTGFRPAFSLMSFRKGEADLYRVTLGNGSKITVTRQHRFLTPDGWASLDDGIAEGDIVAISQGEDTNSPAIRAAYGQPELQKPQDLMARYSADRRRGDAQPLPAEDTGQEHAPSQFDARAHSPALSHMGDHERSEEHSLPCLSSDLPAKRNLTDRGFHDLVATEVYASSSDERLMEPIQQNALQFGLSSLFSGQEGAPIPQSAQPSSGYGFSGDSERLRASGDNRSSQKLPQDDQRSADLSHPGDMPLQSALYPAWGIVSSVEFVRHDAFYDMHVPGPENYVAEGFVNHNTGVGKGRFVAAMLRYAKRNDMIPVFMSKDPGLYADMIRDMRDIGMGDAHTTAMMTNTNMRNKDALPLSAEDPADVLSSLTTAQMKAALSTMLRTGKLPDGLDMVFTTYSQMQTVKGLETDRMNAMRAIAPNAMFVLDESHEAGGGAPGGRVKLNEAGGEIGTRAGFVRELLDKSRGAVFSSATYAKNPNVMSLYAKTDLSLAVDNIGELAQVITTGGVPLQQVIANMLVDAGQYVRREKSYEGIEINPKILATDQKMANTGAEVLRTLFNLDVDYMQDVRESFIKEKEKEGEGSVNDNSVGQSGMTSTNFTSVMHNVAAQFLLAIKVNGIIADAIKTAKSGKKPIIALSNTNGAIMAEQMSRTGAAIGDSMDLPFNLILERYLERLRRISVKVQEGDKEVVKHVVLTDADIIAHGGAAALDAYRKAQKFIKTSNMKGLPGSPIDAILDGLRKAGIKSGEITGRQFVLEDGVLTKREATTAAKKRVMNACNRGDIDALVINRSGSTGFSMHATTRKGNDGKPRWMTIAQAEPNIDLFMQMLGRINRTGQSVLPGFTVAVSDLSVEKRPAAVLMRKMASLNANTTANKKGAVSLDNVTDFLNPYGDRVVARYLWDNPELMHMLDVTPGENNDGLAARFTGRLVSLPPKQVDEIYADVERNYLQLIDALDRLGTNALEAKVLELDARTVSTTELVPAKDESSPFGRAANIEVVDVKKIGRPYSPEQLVDEVVAVVGSDSKKAAADYVNGQIEALRADMPALLADTDARIASAQVQLADADTDKKKENAQDRINRANVEKREAQDKLYRISDMIVKVTPGQLGSITVQAEGEGASETFIAMALGVDTSHAEGRPTAASRMTVRIAIADAGREISIPLSQMLGDQPDYKWSPAPREQQNAMLGAFEKGQTESREQRQIITGNIPAGFAKMGGKGQIILYTDQDGGLRQGIMLGAKFDAAAALRNRPAVFADADQIVEFLRGGRGSRMVTSGDDVLRIGANSDGEISFFITNKGSKSYTLLKAVRDIVGDWTQRGGAKGYSKAVGVTRAKDVIRAYQENLGTEFQTDVDKDVARKITGEVLPDIPGTDGQRDMLQGARAGVARPTGPLAMRPGGLGVRTTPLAKMKAKDIAKDLKRIAERAGLPSIPVEVVEEAFLMTDGETVPLGGAFFRGAITIAMQANGKAVDMPSVMNHELVHMLRNPDVWGRTYGLFRPAEWQELERAARKNSALLELTRRDYPDEGDRLQLEETIARMYQGYIKGESDPKGFLKSAFERIKAFFNALRDALTGNGFQTADQIFTAMERGDIGRRGQQDGPLPEFTGEAQLSRAMKRDAAIASAQAGEELETGVTPLVPPKRRQDTFLRTAMIQPLDAAFRVPFMMAGGLDQAGRWKYGKAAEAKLRDFIVNKDAGFMAPLVERVRAGMIDRYGLPDDYVERERRRGVDAALIAAEGKEHIEAIMRHKMGAEESRVLQAVLTGEAVADADMAKVSEPIRKAIDDLGAEAVELGLISRESYERNRGKYLHRVYAKHETDETTIEKWNKAFASTRRRKIIGDQFKGRGIFEEVEAERIFRDNPEFLEAKRGKPQPGDKVIILDLRRGANVPELPDMAAPKGRLQRRVYWPADVKLPDRLNNYESRGTFEVRGTQNGKVVLWRDFTKPERLKMGEIMDARYTIAKTYAMMSEDLATGRFFRDIALNEDWSRKAPPPEAKIDEDPQSRAWGKRMWSDPSLEWVKVPESKISKSDTFRYGALAGRYVRADIWRDMEELRAMQTPNFWAKLLAEWKKNKTARNPVVHMNNVMSNMMLMDMADIRVHDLIRGIMSYAQGDASYQEAAMNGAFGTDQVTAELRDNVLKPMLSELKKEMQGDKGGFEGEVGRVGRVLDRLVKAVKWADGKMMDAYMIEDQVFRMATYIRRREQGFTVGEAATEARDQFLNYDIRAPWINAARRSLLPFIGYTYRAVPKIAQTVAERPWKIAKYVAVMQAANMMAYAVAPSDDDEDEERRSMPAREQGYTWTGSPRMVRMPWLDDSGNPVFLDVRRWLPAGDVFDTNGGDIPAWLQVGGPLVIGMELYLNRQAFTGDDIVNPLIDTLGERMHKRADFLYRSLMPSAPWVWNSWYYDQIKRAFGQQERQWGTGELYDPLEAVLSSIGIKMKGKDVELGFAVWQLEFDRIERELGFAASRARRDFQLGRMSQQSYDRAIDGIVRKRQALQDRAATVFDN